MTPLLTVNLLRVLFVTFCAAIGAIASSELQGGMWPGVVIGLLLGLVVVLIDRLLKGFSLRAFSSATFGLLLGWVFAKLLSASQILIYLPPTTQWAIGLVVYCTFGYLGMMLAMRSNRDEFSLIIPYVRFARETTQHEPLVLDTNVIIDGRIAELCATGFQRSRDVELIIHESSDDVDLGVDARLVRTAKVLQASLLTNDQALCQVARLQQVPALNLADLSRALRPVFVVGDEIELALVKEGREQHQAVGYLPDGTMIVVNHARPHLGKTATVVVSSALQTTAGRLIFAELKDGAKGALS